MRHTPSVADAEIVPIADAENVRPKPLLALEKPRKSIFMMIIETLHCSRRLQAERFLREHRDLVETARRSVLREFHSRDEAERCWRDLGSGRRPDL